MSVNNRQNKVNDPEKCQTVPVLYYLNQLLDKDNSGRLAACCTANTSVDSV